MGIEILSRREIFALVDRARLARLACASQGMPYVVPINYVRDGLYIYSFATFGKKIEWMRSNPKVCVEIDDIANNRRWESVVATGEYEELADTPQGGRDLRHAWSLLQTQTNWWEPGTVRSVVSGSLRPLAPIFYRIRLDDITGHRLVLSVVRPPQDAAGLSRLVRTIFGRRDNDISAKAKQPSH